MLKAFQERFAYLQKFDNLFKNFMCPFDIPVDKAPDSRISATGIDWSSIKYGAEILVSKKWKFLILQWVYSWR